MSAGRGQHRIILHADMDAFFASVEQRDRPELRGKPVIVGATSPRGVVAAASYEARAYGVRSAMPGFRARELCPSGVYLPADMDRYSRVSDQVHRVFEEHTPDIEPIALDEAFLDVTGSARLFGGPVALARRVKRRVREETGLVASVGVGPNKLVAKIACSLSKPDGLLVVPAAAVRWLLDPLPVRRIWGIGPVLDHALAAAGIRTVAQLRCFDPEALRRIVGDRAFELQRLASGQDEREVESRREPKSFGEESTFERDLFRRADIARVLVAHAETVTRRLRHDEVCGRTVTLKIKLARRRGARRGRTDAQTDEPIYPVVTRSRTLPRPTDDASVVRDVALELWDAARIAEPVRLLGISVSRLERAPREQLQLFSEGPRTRGLGPALDAIEARFGRGTIGRMVPDPGKITRTTRRKRGD